MVKILIADDHELIHKGIRDILRAAKNVRIIGNAYNGKEAVELAIQLQPDIILMDISMPIMNGIEATEKIHRLAPRIKLIALTQHEEMEYVMHFIKSGGSGYLLKNSSKDEFIGAIDAVIQEETVISKKISEQMLQQLMNKKTKEVTDEENIPLTKREVEIIKKIADDMSNQEIADDLHISLRTVETHRRNLMQKLNVKTVVALLKLAVRRKLISFE